MNLVLNYESSALAAPQSFRDAMQTAANILDVEILDNITVTILVGYGDWNNGAFTTKKGQALGGSLDDLFVNYSDLRSALAAHETSVLDQSVVNSLPNTSTIDNHYAFGVSSAVAKALGLMSPTASVIDGAVGFDPSIPTNLLVGAALHELTHAMGREPSSGVSGSGAAIAAGTFDFVRYTSAGNHLYSTDGTAVPAYFSIDGGNTKLADFGQTSDSSDFLNSGVQGPNDPFNEFGNSKTIQSLTAVDREVLDAIGFNTTPAILQTDGSTSLAQGGNHYLLISGSTESGLMYGGAPVTAGQFGSISPIGAVQTANGYDIAWKVPGTNEFTFWSTDINGIYTSNLSGLVSGNSFAVEQFETVFGQDLNGDGTVGVTSSLIQTAGSTSLLAIADNYYIYTHGSG
ncbi:MAG: NF038122 family metalloprotease, partial [Bradyrhizobium sp.]|nr:NF038122 family metalloprotease [Bradyrhizobium sp.]